jgi:DNA-directed RNA polymerase subunit RPC12/RpoP
MTELWVEDPDLPGYWKRPPLTCPDCGGKLEYPIDDLQVVIDHVIQTGSLRCVRCGHRFTLKVEAVNFLVRADEPRQAQGAGLIKESHL